MLSSLLEFYFTPFQTSVNGVAEYGNLGVQLVILPIVELRLETVSFGSLELIELNIDLE